jgi:hypothetical protein
MNSPLPAEFSPRAYQRQNPDLVALNRAQLRDHWKQLGIHENRVASKIRSRDKLLEQCLEGCIRLLEIGPFDKPSLTAFENDSTTVVYADYLSTEELKDRATETPGRFPENVPIITHRLSEGFPEVDIPFDGVVSHHCIEHQPDLIGHINNVFSILGAEGRYVFTAPHKEHCFDHFIPESTYLEAVVAHQEQRKRPTLRSVIEHRCFTRADYIGVPDPYREPGAGMRECMDSAHAEYNSCDYNDVHCWQFTPASIKSLLENASRLGLTPRLDIRVFCLGPEFGCVLSRTNPVLDYP